jgi:hypothetical protein
VRSSTLGIARALPSEARDLGCLEAFLLLLSCSVEVFHHAAGVFRVLNILGTYEMRQTIRPWFRRMVIDVKKSTP